MVFWIASRTHASKPSSTLGRPEFKFVIPDATSSSTQARFKIRRSVFEFALRRSPWTVANVVSSSDKTRPHGVIGRVKREDDPALG